MSKEKKKSLNLLKELDRGLDATYNTIEEEIEAYQKRIATADKLAEKEIRRKMRKNPNVVYTTKQQRSVRDDILRRMEKTGFVERCTQALRAVVPTLVMFARMVAAFIMLLLQIRPIQKLVITRGWDTKLTGLYNLAMSVKI